MKKQTELKEKTSTLDDLQNKLDEMQFNNSKNDLNIVEDFNIIQNKTSKMEVQRKIQKNMSKIAQKLQNTKPINFESIPIKFYDEKGEDIDLGQILPSEPEPNTLPAITSKELRAAGTLDIKWTDTKDLPLGQDRHIKALAKAVFSGFDIEENSNVMCINSFKDDDFLNEPREVNAVTGYLDKYAQSPHIGIMKQCFGETIKDYEPEIRNGCRAAGRVPWPPGGER